MSRSRNFLIAALSLGIGAFGCESHHHHHHHDGTAETEMKMEPASLPAAVTNALKASMPNAVITEAEHETKDGREVYSLDVKDGGKLYDVVITPDGKIVSTKEESGEKD